MYKPGMNALIVEVEYRREQAMKKIKRSKCTIDKTKQCDKCKYFQICTDREEKA